MKISQDQNELLTGKKKAFFIIFEELSFKRKKKLKGERPIFCSGRKFQMFLLEAYGLTMKFGFIFIWV